MTSILEHFFQDNDKFKGMIIFGDARGQLPLELTGSEFAEAKARGGIIHVKNVELGTPPGQPPVRGTIHVRTEDVVMVIVVEEAPRIQVASPSMDVNLRTLTEL